MAKEICSNCYVKLAQPVAFCPSCERPTRHASDSERLEWDLKQWRSHVDRSVAGGMNPARQAVGFGAAASVAVAPESPPEPRLEPAPLIKPRIVPMPALRRPKREREPRPERAPEPEREPKQRRIPRLKRVRSEPQNVVQRDRDNEFAYRSCATCNESDWIVRYSRNDDETWNYWCVRCSRSFKTEVRLHQALKPFLSGGVVVGGLTAASLLLFR